jgi:hypothetical protein
MANPAAAAPEAPKQGPRRRGGHPRKPRKAGRPLRKDPQDAYFQALRDGHGPTTAAGRAGVLWDTVQNWRKQEEFLRRENQALADWADALTRRVKRDARANGELALKVLARRVPKDWAPPERHEVSGPDGEPVPMKLMGFDPKAFPPAPVAPAAIGTAAASCAHGYPWGTCCHKTTAGGS